MNQGQFNAIIERLDQLIALLEAQRAATIAKSEMASAFAATQSTAGEEKPKPVTKGKK